MDEDRLELCGFESIFRRTFLFRHRHQLFSFACNPLAQGVRVRKHESLLRRGIAKSRTQFFGRTELAGSHDRLEQSRRLSDVLPLSLDHRVELYIEFLRVLARDLVRQNQRTSQGDVEIVAWIRLIRSRHDRLAKPVCRFIECGQRLRRILRFQGICSGRCSHTEIVGRCITKHDIIGRITPCFTQQRGRRDRITRLELLVSTVESRAGTFFRPARILSKLRVVWPGDSGCFRRCRWCGGCGLFGLSLDRRC